MSQDNVQALPLGTRLGDYRLDAMIGHGGFGITYRAFDTQLAKIVAIKEYLPVEFAIRRNDGQVVPRGARFADDFAWGRERFLDEARALARFRHPHIVPVLRYFEANGTAYTVMEFEDGRSLGELLREPGRRVSPEDVRRLAEGLLSGLGTVHAQDFLHRDIKPSNIMIRRDGVPILIDFGAARQAMGERTRTLTGVLTPQYAPIEQYALDGKQGPWSDLYSAAAVLHHAIAGRPPPDAAARAGKDPYRPLADTHGDRFEPAFLAAVDRALAFAPAERPQSIAEWRTLFGASLRRAMDAPTQRLVHGQRRGAAATGRREPRSRRAHRGGSAAAAESPDGLDHRRPDRCRGGGAVAFSARDHRAARGRAGRPGRGLARERAACATAGRPQPSTSQPAASQPAAPPASPVPSTAPAAERSSEKAIVDQARRAAAEAKAMLQRADEAARAARSMAGEARIAAARAGQPDLENAQRLSYEGGASYIGQVADGKRQGLGVAELANGERQAGEWQADRLNGLGTVQLADGTRYAGQWRDGQSTGLGVRGKPKLDRAEGNFVDGRLEGLAVRRTLAEPNVVRSGTFHGDALEGPGVESVGDRERYEGGFRDGKRDGYGQLTTDGKTVAGRWQAGKLVESAP